MLLLFCCIYQWQSYFAVFASFLRSKGKQSSNTNSQYFSLETFVVVTVLGPALWSHAALPSTRFGTPVCSTESSVTSEPFPPAVRALPQPRLCAATSCACAEAAGRPQAVTRSVTPHVPALLPAARRRHEFRRNGRRGFRLAAAAVASRLTGRPPRPDRGPVGPPEGPAASSPTGRSTPPVPFPTVRARGPFPPASRGGVGSSPETWPLPPRRLLRRACARHRGAVRGGPRRRPASAVTQVGPGAGGPCWAGLGRGEARGGGGVLGV